MIKTEQLLYEIDLKLNKQATLQHQNIPDEDKLVALNNAQINYILSVVQPLNSQKLGFESFNKRYDDLQEIVVPFEKLEITKKEGDVLNKWTAPLDKLEKEYMLYVKAYALANKGNCKDVVIYVNNDLTKHRDVVDLFNSPSYRPSFEYQETFDTISEGNIEIYSDGTFEFSALFLSYIRHPKSIDIAGYIHLDGEESIDQDSELPSYLKDTLVDMAIEDLAMSTENQAAVQYTEARLQKK